MALITNLVSYYKLDDATDAHGANDATNVGTVGFSTGKLGNGAAFDGTDKVLRLSSATGLSGNTQGTVAAWIKLNAAGSSNPFFAVGENDNNGTLLIWWFRATNAVSFNRLQVTHRGPNTNVLGSTTLLVDTWYHVAVTSDGSTWKMYVNGGVETLTVVGSNNGDWWGDVTGTPLNYEIGRIPRGTTNLGLCNGTIDELGIWSVALSDAEILSLYNGDAGLAYPFIRPQAIRQMSGGLNRLTGGLAV